MRTGTLSGALFLTYLTPVLCLLLFSGCGKKDERPVRNDLIAKSVVIAPSASPAPATWNRWLSDHMADAVRFTPDQLDQAVDRCLASDLVLIITGSDDLADTANTTLDQFMNRGGRLLVLGANHASLFSAPSTYAATAEVFRVAGRKEPIAIAKTEAVCRFPGPTGVGGESADDTRWIPIVTALSPDDQTIGTVGSVSLHPRSENTYAIQGWLSIHPARDEDGLVLIIESMLEAMSRDAYLMRYGTDHYSLRSQQASRISARVVDRRVKDATPVRIAVEWINRQGVEIRRHVSPPFDTLSAPITLNIGLAPDVVQQAEMYTLRYSIRDRNDQRTLDQVDQPIKVFPLQPAAMEKEPITVLSGRLTQGRKPIFMLGVNYWPRNGAELSSGSGHWLDATRFHPEILRSDLDMMLAAGINAVALEYTDISQAPQLLFALDEIRRRALWTVLYVPAFHPLDVRMDEGLKMLEAIHLGDWPEVFAIEIARGLAVKTRSERRHLDQAWDNWVDEHYNSPIEAEQKLGISLWRERGRMTGPPDRQLMRGPHQDRAIALYYSFLRDNSSRHMGEIRETLREKGYHQLITARTAYAWPGNKTPGVLDTLDLSAGVHHLDFVFPDAWLAHPLHVENADGPLLFAYARGISGGKPVLWSEYGHHVGSVATPSSTQRQKEVYKYYIDMFIEQGASGAFAWWFPPGLSVRADEDWGLVNPQGTWRPVEEVLRTSRLRLRQARSRQVNVVRQNATLIQSASQWRAQHKSREGFFMAAAASTASPVTDWLQPGSGMESVALLNPIEAQSWSEIDGLHMLNAEWSSAIRGGSAQNRSPGENVRTYTGRPIEMEIINSGTIQWTRANDRQPGSIWLRISQPGHADEWLSVSPLPPGAREKIRWTPRESGVWDFQPFMIGYGRFGERLRIEATSPPQLF